MGGSDSVFLAFFPMNALFPPFHDFHSQRFFNAWGNCFDAFICLVSLFAVAFYYEHHTLSWLGPAALALRYGVQLGRLFIALVK